MASRSETNWVVLRKATSPITGKFSTIQFFLYNKNSAWAPL